MKFGIFVLALFSLISCGSLNSKEYIGEVSRGVLPKVSSVSCINGRLHLNYSIQIVSNPVTIDFGFSRFFPIKVVFKDAHKKIISKTEIPATISDKLIEHDGQPPYDDAIQHFDLNLQYPASAAYFDVILGSTNVIVSDVPMP